MTADGQTYAEALASGRERLKDSPTAALDARVLLEQASGHGRADLIAMDNEAIPDSVAERYDAMVARREKGEPIAYITGRQEFYGRSFSVGRGVLIPRPETEMLVEAAIAARPGRVLDCGTGSGCILLSILAELPRTTGLGFDISDDALNVAHRNRSALRLDDRAALERFAFADAALGLGRAVFDVVVANPPYIPEGTQLPVSVAEFEPASALYAGQEGLRAHREIAAIIDRHLAPGGSAFIEIGHDQGGRARVLYENALRPRRVQTRLDAAGHPRMVAVGPASGL